VKPLFAGVALVALAAATAGCGGRSTATRLRIEVSDRHGVHAYRLECGPAGGSAPQPTAICRALRLEPKLLVGGPGLALSCPGLGPGPGADETFRVSGTYRGHAVDALSSTGCGYWVPGQGDAGTEWSYLMDDREGGVPERDLGTAPVNSAQRRRKREDATRFHRLLRLERAATRARSGAIAAGRIDVGHGARPDRSALAIIRARLGSTRLLRLPEVFDADVYSTTRRRAEAALGSGRDLTRPNGPVYLVVTHYAYRDYLGHRRRDDQPWWSLYDAKTLQVEAGGGGGGGGNLRGIGAPVALSF